jgi:pimeloyl-ACP methyl ester carboxylesterase
MRPADRLRTRQVSANGLQHNLVDEGDGPPVVLLHGFPDTALLWRHQVPALVGAGYRVIAPDLRGRGRTEAPARVEDYGLRNVVADVAGLLDALGLGRAHVVGHDWGAAVAWLVGALRPERVDRLAVLSVGHPSAWGRPSLEALQKGWYRLLFLFEGVAEELLRRDDWYLAREMLPGYRDLNQALVELDRPGALTAGLNWYRANLPAHRLLGPPRTLPAIQAPTLGAWSSGDLYLTEERMLRSGEFVQGPWRYERFEGAGHWIPLDEPERLNALLLEFLGGPEA